MAGKNKKKSNNKNACNAFYFFMLHEQKRGTSLCEVSKMVGDKWTNMSPQQRAPFEALAKAEKEKQRKNGEKLTSQGIPYSVIDHDKMVRKDQENAMKVAIEEYVTRAEYNDSLADVDFFFIDINKFVTTNDNKHLLAELAISRFNLRKGVYDAFHLFINPGPIPTGYSYDAKAYTSEQHHLPLPPEALGDSDMAFVYAKMMQFLSNGHETIQPLYTKSDNMEFINQALQQICDNSEIENDFQVYNISEMFMHLRNACARKSGSRSDMYPTISMADIEIDKDLYDYSKRIACEFHESTDVLHKCCLSRVKRWGFIIADNCCQDLEINLIPGKHIPYKAVIEREFDDGWSQVSVRSSRNSAKPSNMKNKENFTPSISSEAHRAKSSTNESIVSGTSNISLAQRSVHSVSPNSVVSKTCKQTGDVMDIRLPKTQSICGADSTFNAGTSYASVSSRGRLVKNNSVVSAFGRGRGLIKKDGN